MIRIPKIDLKALLQYDQLKRLLSKDSLSRLSRAENLSWNRLLAALGGDGYALAHAALLVILIAAILGQVSSGCGLSQSICLSAFAYVNAATLVFCVRHRMEIDWRRAGLTCFALFLIAIGIFLLIYSAFKSLDRLLSAAIALGVFAFPVMAFDREFRDRVIRSCFATFFKSLDGAFSGGSVEAIGMSILCTALLGAVLIMIMLVCGTLAAVSFYIGGIAELLALSEKFRKGDLPVRPPPEEDVAEQVTSAAPMPTITITQE